MSMNESIVRQAATEYARGNYGAALAFYKKLASMLGDRFFQANVLLCEKRLEGNEGAASGNPALKEIKVACVMDEFSFASYKDTCTLLNLSIDSWERDLEEFLPDILFIESAWRGKEEAWNGKISRASAELVGVLDWCKARDVPTLFWNKEDPVHYGTFLSTAKLFDNVFTTDIGCIANYKRDLGHECVYLLPFGCNPVEQNPIEKFSRRQSANFAGSYYVRYPERARDLDTLLSTFVEHCGVEIYDRQHGKGDVNYAFPEKYHPLILGNLKYEQIDIAYKGYQYGINLNSVKRSSTMFARRVYELLACNTIVVSNYSLGVRQLFSELVVSSDSKTELKRRIEALSANSAYRAQLKAAGLRKVMTEHTYENRFSYVAEKVLGRKRGNLLPRINVLAVAYSSEELDRLVNMFRNFQYDNKSLTVAVRGDSFKLPAGGDGNERLVRALSFADAVGKFDAGSFFTLLKAENFYDKNYLVDLAIATKYTTAKIIAKGQFAEQRAAIGSEYMFGNAFYPDAALLSHEGATTVVAQALAALQGPAVLKTAHDEDVFYIDALSFYSGSKEEWAELPAENQIKINAGVKIDDVFDQAERVAPAVDLQIDALQVSAFTGGELGAIFDPPLKAEIGVVFTVRGSELQIDVGDNAKLPYYCYAKDPFPVEELWPNRDGKIYLEASPGLNLSSVAIFFDAKKNRLSHSIPTANLNQTVDIPQDAAFVRFGIRVAGSQAAARATIKRVIFDHVASEHNLAWVPSGKHLLIAPNYPEYDDYYRYGFVHRRVKSYRERGVVVDVLRFRPGSDLKLYEYEDVDVVSGGATVLEKVLHAGRYSSIAVHALDQEMWNLVSQYLDTTKVVVWLHGAEIQSWKRRMFNYATPQEVSIAKSNGERRDAFWKSVFALQHPNLHFVFVSNYFMREVIGDLDIEIQPENLHIIHNPIDQSIFSYQRKDKQLRKRILSVRPYATRVYANDLTVKTILELSNRPYFEELNFLLVGDGMLFDETVAPVRHFTNVEIRRKFLSQTEIAELHKEYGVFLCPSRMDTQGVSRDEAMSSGLVPITNGVGAIAEFLSEEAGFICDEEDYLQLAAAIDRLYHDPELFIKMSETAAASIRQSRGDDLIATQEIALIN